jgi:hypothetical protein
VLKCAYAEAQLCSAALDAEHEVLGGGAKFACEGGSTLVMFSCGGGGDVSSRSRTRPKPSRALNAPNSPLPELQGPAFRGFSQWWPALSQRPLVAAEETPAGDQARAAGSC